MLGIYLCVLGMILDTYLFYIILIHPNRKPRKSEYRKQIREFYEHMDAFGVNYYDAYEILNSYTYKQLVETNKKLRKLNKDEKGILRTRTKSL